MLRFTCAAAPSSPSVQAASGLPFAALVSPLAPTPASAPDPEPEEVNLTVTNDLEDIIASDTSSIPRCSSCSAYISSLATLTPRWWICPLCQHRNPLPSQYAPVVRAGPSAIAQIPELSRPVYDLNVPDDAPLTPQAYVFVVDSSGDAAYLDAMRLAVRNALNVIDGPTFVGLLLFDSHISLVDARSHPAIRRFHPSDKDLSPCTVFPPHQWLRPSSPALSEIFMHVLSNLTPVSPSDAKPPHPFGDAINTALDMVEAAHLTATRIVTILAAEPDRIEGSTPAAAATPASDSLPSPRTTFFAEQGARAAACSAMVDVYLACRSPLDVASLAPLAHLSGGRLHLYDNADDTISRDMWQHLNDPAVVRAMLRVRASAPFVAADAYGSGVWRDDSVPDVFRLSCHGHSSTLAVDLAFDPDSHALSADGGQPVVQVAFRGVFLEPGALPSRVLRVETRRLRVATSASTMRAAGDARAVVAATFHHAVAAADEVGIAHARVQLFDWLSFLVARTQEAEGLGGAADVEAPLRGCNALADVPRLVFGLVRSPLFRQSGVAADARVALRALWEDLSPDLLAAAAYPHLESWADVETRGRDNLVLSAAAVRECGHPIFLLDALSEVVIFYSEAADGESLKFPPPEGSALMKARAGRLRDRPISPRLLVCREGTPKEQLFKRHLIEEAVAGAAAQSFSAFMQGVLDASEEVAVATLVQ